MSKSLNYASKLTHLRSDTTHDWDSRTKGRAPHKPFLLLSIMDGIENGRITDNRIHLDQELIESFFTYWNGVMGAEDDHSLALLPHAERVVLGLS